MEATLGIVLSVLSATATAVWTVWTWSEQQKEERTQKRNQIAALYINPFLFAAQELQVRLDGIINQQELEFFKREYPETDEIGSPEALELLYVLVKFFGWYWYVYRYGPYTRDKKAIELISKIIRTFANREDFAGDTFYFSFSEQRSLGQTFVKVFGQAESIYPELEAISLYQFATELRDDIQKDRPMYQNVIKTIQVIDSAERVEQLQGCDRLIAVHNDLVDLLSYLEAQEGFCISPKVRQKIQSPASLPTDTEIIHAIAGRVRLRIPRLRQDLSYAERLRQCLQSLAGVQEIQINPDAASVAISYAPTLSEATFQQRLFQAIAQSGSVN
ncbi:hypothetical protein PN437_15815 [Microcystis aeruginosa CS-564/01]|uniref:HMA2 domain-containing protein n=1 Tax=Microcystis aeruginosa TaxID=1126 RepID=UPI00232E9CC0|nr:hypothetical protein [Microcystis aeruginosa]MDB9426335.1 hypothetical protein [Microcystis aeruginosa CS-564/01]